MSVIGVLAQANVGHHQQVQIRFAHRFDGPLHHAVGGVGFRSQRVFFSGNAEQDHSGNAELFHFAAFLEKRVHRLLRNSRHRAIGLRTFLPGHTNMG